MSGDRRQKTIRRAWWGVAVAVVGVLVYLMATAGTGPSDPTEAGASQAHATVVANSAIIVFREGLEAVLIFRSRRLPAGSSTVLEGVAIGLAGTAVVGALTFWLHHKLPYRRMLVLTGVLVGFVLVVMIGGTALTFQDLGWLPRHETPFTLPGWMGSWFEMYSTWETLAAQALAALFVVGSYVLARE